MRAIGKLPKSVLILEFIGMMLLAVALLSVSDTLSLPEPFSRPEVQILMLLYSEQCWPGESSLFLHRADKKICTFIAYLSV